MAEEADSDALAAYVATLFPFQQQAIATAQLAGCRFECRRVERSLGWERDMDRFRQKWVDTTEYEVFLPDGTSAGEGEDIYECALIALSILNTPAEPRPSVIAAGLFALSPENEQT
jgi:hypothetical protein